ncbi:hypothetical protein DPMN_027937 [Dreissena polymorpha]|uniref:Uncharacterized protein n=1 Tax=Dreissena polymorpha TaxID=45954 RepID=A0A9D4LW32_DREPO|nr:hypothetical protein DPMN_027937 [Dreissena polymorpha]
MLHDDWKINWASRKNARPPGGHFQEDRKINVTSRVLTRKNAPFPGGYIFQPTGTNLQTLTPHNARREKGEGQNIVLRINYPPHGGNFFNRLELFSNSSKISLKHIF